MWRGRAERPDSSRGPSFNARRTAALAAPVSGDRHFGKLLTQRLTVYIERPTRFLLPGSRGRGKTLQGCPVHCRELHATLQASSAVAFFQAASGSNCEPARAESSLAQSSASQCQGRPDRGKVHVKSSTPRIDTTIIAIDKPDARHRAHFPHHPIVHCRASAGPRGPFWQYTGTARAAASGHSSLFVISLSCLRKSAHEL